MKRGIPPFAQIHARQLVRLARDAGIDLVVGQHHRVHLDRLNVVGIVTEDSREADLANFGQLFEGEGRRPAGVLVPETVAGAEMAELVAHDAGKRRTDHRPCVIKNRVKKYISL